MKDHGSKPTRRAGSSRRLAHFLGMIGTLVVVDFLAHAVGVS